MQPRSIRLANGLRVRLMDSGGSGPPVVLVHGLANSLEIWSRVVPALARRFRVIAFDLPGFGRSDRPDAAYDGDFFAGQLFQVLDALELDRAHLVGNSLGASVVLHCAGRALERIDRAVLAAPGGFGRRTHPLMRISALPWIGYALGKPTPFNNRLTLRLAMHDRSNIGEDLVSVVDRYAAIPGSHRAFVRTLRAGVGVFGSKDVAGTAARARRFERPVLVVWGKQDRVFPAVYAGRAGALLPQSQRLLIDACGHYPQWEQPETFAAAVAQFLA